MQFGGLGIFGLNDMHVKSDRAQQMPNPTLRAVPNQPDPPQQSAAITANYQRYSTVPGPARHLGAELNSFEWLISKDLAFAFKTFVLLYLNRTVGKPRS